MCKIPPAISNWKNTKGYIVPLDKRLLAVDGRSRWPARACVCVWGGGGGGGGWPTPRMATARHGVATTCP